MSTNQPTGPRNGADLPGGGSPGGPGVPGTPEAGSIRGGQARVSGEYTGPDSTGGNAFGRDTGAQAVHTSEVEQAPEAPRPKQEPQSERDRRPAQPKQHHQPDKPGASMFVWVGLILGALILVLLLVFILQNIGPVDIRYFGWEFSMPLGVAMLLSAIAGILVAGIVGTVRILLLGRRLKNLQKGR